MPVALAACASLASSSGSDSIARNSSSGSECLRWLKMLYRLNSRLGDVELTRPLMQEQLSGEEGVNRVALMPTA